MYVLMSHDQRCDDKKLKFRNHNKFDILFIIIQ